MKIIKYGVTLKRLTKDKIELVRNWRNDPKIAQYMEYKEYITPEMQEKWFEKIDNDNNFYFIVEVEGFEIGLANIKDIEYKTGVGEPGLFIYDDNYLNTIIPFYVTLCLMDFSFNTLQLESTYIHVLENNKRAIKFNKSLGYTLGKNQEAITNQRYTLTVESYIQNKQKLIKLLKYDN